MENLHKELRFAAVCTVLLDVLLWICSLFAVGLGISVPLGLSVGSVAMYLNLLLLRQNVQNAVYHGRTRTMPGYLLRLAVTSAAFASGLLFRQVSLLAVVLPFLYPKLIFGILAVKPNNRK